MIGWIQGHWQDVVGIIGAIVILARIIVKLTPTPKDNAALQKVVNFLKLIGLHVD